MRTKQAVLGAMALGLGLTGCGHVVYDSRASFDYRVAHLRQVSVTGGQPGSGRLLGSEGVVFETGPSGQLLSAEDGRRVMVSGGDGSILMRLPPGTYSVGFEALGPARVTAAIEGGGDEAVKVGEGGFVGIVSQKEVREVRVSGGEVGVRGVEIEKR